jgi:hypothetical protein
MQRQRTKVKKRGKQRLPHQRSRERDRDTQRGENLEIDLE